MELQNQVGHKPRNNIPLLVGGLSLRMIRNSKTSDSTHHWIPRARSMGNIGLDVNPKFWFLYSVPQPGSSRRLHGYCRRTWSNETLPLRIPSEGLVSALWWFLWFYLIVDNHPRRSSVEYSFSSDRII